MTHYELCEEFEARLHSVKTQHNNICVGAFYILVKNNFKHLKIRPNPSNVQIINESAWLMLVFDVKNEEYLINEMCVREQSINFNVVMIFYM